MRQFLSAVKTDMLFQFRHGFYIAYLLVAIIYIILLKAIPSQYQEMLTIFVIFSDPAILGFFFIGGIYLLEKGQNILENIFVTPFKVTSYLISKIVSLTWIALIFCLLILILVYGFQINYLPITLSILLTSTFFTLLGITLVVRVGTVNEYLFIVTPLYITIFFLPVLEILDIYQSSLFFILPSKASLLLLEGAFRTLTVAEWSYAIFTLLIWIAIAFLFAKNIFYRYVILKIGDE
ncbi:fluoroquinolone export ABC transporter permease subunit [Chengkuizengella axinellae]|uniref:ABC transporter permease n=1 Tax=Chengkuizengella axinellae TaxID=3064388 RepID=A0ABT9IWT5_9BACL|nr:hypothetical protein [Chengkuizengella sp. 2205SS18-9]MDP5273269.1 hypothetical protein [Chengkuizengella sp. 2205SS18-9]